MTLSMLSKKSKIGTRTRTAHQEAAKTNILDEMKPTQVLVIMDWAMKYLPVRFRETQAEWYGKKGRPWHVSAAITKIDKNEIEVT